MISILTESWIDYIVYCSSDSWPFSFRLSGACGLCEVSNRVYYNLHRRTFCSHFPLKTYFTFKMSLTMTWKFKRKRSCWPWPVFWTLSTFGLAFHPSHAHLHLLLEQLVLFLWWFQSRSQGEFPGLGAGREKGGCGASSRSAFAAFFNSLDSVISESVQSGGRGFDSHRGQKIFFFTSCGSLIPFTRANAQWVIHGFN